MRGAPTGADVRSNAASAPGADILYASASSGSAVYAFSYPLGAAMGKIVPPKGTIALEGICSDAAGDIYVTALSGDEEGHVYMYQHGGTRPVNQWNFERVVPFGCSYDGPSGKLAVSTVSLGVASGALFVIDTDSQESSVYYSYDISNYYYCGYDAKGDLFVNGQGFGTQMKLAELRKGAKSLTDIALQPNISVSGMGEVQWDGHYITVEDLTDSRIYRLRISGAKATVAGTAQLSGWNGPALSWIQGSTVVVPTGIGGASLGAWKYPRGGKPTKTAKAPGGMFGVTVSVAP
jgi:hypothetical protein